MVAKALLPFDAHNHIQLGPPPPSSFSCDDGNAEIIPSDNSLVKSLGKYIQYELQGKHLSGMALMATHPRDFGTLLDLERELRSDKTAGSNSEESMTVLPCLGVHPWFLHELDPIQDWALVPSSTSFLDGREDQLPQVPSWIGNLESLLTEHPHLPVGEIGLDNFHFDPITQELTTPMEKQIEALKLQLQVATNLHRPVSLHCVRAMGKLMDVLEDVAEENFQLLSKEWNSEIGDNEEICCSERNHILPPKLYFHAFGGKAATATQLVKTLEKPRRIKIRNDSVRLQTKKKFVSVPPPKVYFGFAPPVNFQSPKTASVIRAVGLDRLVLETDREDIRNIGPDMEAGISWISEVLEVTKDELVLKTNKNARELYNCGIDDGTTDAIL